MRESRGAHEVVVLPWAPGRATAREIRKITPLAHAATLKNGDDATGGHRGTAPGLRREYILFDA